ncbi:hypothetical protein IE81DRAFT_364798 [Ceraceosorus guamensis]|uniref:Uncharacterized protein n=1 Tax=Ceraceosorus guamensis TaxID=1522189 RepID=A0A316WA59_9BASI|nr:hypothetical protein IE81DRAFT_364798 [Ceraceosorus guamensis]PWN44525.1 hypothetical protein IE81DRAFT_364798 [Ceraceosorus guamensis]
MSSAYLSSAVSRISGVSASEELGDSAAHQPGVSPPLSPVNERDIELSAPLPVFRSHERPPSPEMQLRRGSASAHTPAPLHEAELSQGASFGHAPSAYPPPAPSTVLGAITPGTEEADPLLLRSRLVSDTDLRRRPSQAKGGRKAEKRMREFYDEQNLHIERLLKPMHQHASEDAEEMASVGRSVKFLIYINIAANFVLAGLQLFAAISSGSLSLFATAADSVFDPFANIFLNWLHRKSERLDERKWPSGGSRITNAGNIAYSCIMLSVSLILIVESIRDIATHKAGEENDLYIPSLVAVGVAFATKLTLAVVNYGLRKYSSQLEMLYVDCRNDLWINGFGIFTAAAGAKIAWWIDPLGAIIISIGIVVVWTRTAFSEFKELCGASAPTEFYQLVTYNAMLHSEHIKSIDSIKAYHSGPNYFVEVDIVMDSSAPLSLTHDVSQDLQDRLESLPRVERCFVHVDWEVTHAPEHRKTR